MGCFRVWLEALDPGYQQRGSIAATALSPTGTQMRNYMGQGYAAPIKVSSSHYPFAPKRKGQNFDYTCENCKHQWNYPRYLGKPSSCPRCGFAAKKSGE